MRPMIDTTKPHPARRYDAWLGGKDNFAADRATAGFPRRRGRQRYFGWGTMRM